MGSRGKDHGEAEIWSIKSQWEKLGVRVVWGADYWGTAKKY